MTNNTMTDSSIERIVMRRIYRARAVRTVVSGATLSLVLLALALYGIGREVWVARVFQNMPHQGLVAIGRFYLFAFADTRAIVQLLSILVIASLIYLARSFAQLLAPRPVFANGRS
jgi:branched-subunit amino acid ABC-type transport system permease component